jgi:uncharacterized protein YndB with AHSA1/START domain
MTDLGFDEQHDLAIEHVIDITPEQAFAGWTQPDLLVQWFTPAPWTTTAADVDLRPGGEFHTVMQSPEGDIVNEAGGCYLEVVENRRLVWTSALGPGFRPNDIGEGGFAFTAVLSFDPVDGGRTRYRAHVMHATEAQRTEHEQMGFVDGWTAAMTQLVALMQRVG